MILSFTYLKRVDPGHGSSAEDLAKGADMMPGRRGRRHPVDLELLPIPYSKLHKRLKFEDYLLTGGFPWALNEYLRLGPFSKWDAIFKDPMTMAAAIDRLIHQSVILELQGPSYRMEKDKARKEVEKTEKV